MYKMNWKHHLFTALVSCLLGGGIATLVTVNSTRVSANANAKSAEITEIVQRVDAYEKIISNLNENLTFYADKAFKYMQENEKLKQEVVVLRSELEKVTRKVSQLEKNLAFNETY